MANEMYIEGTIKQLTTKDGELSFTITPAPQFLKECVDKKWHLFVSETDESKVSEFCEPIVIKVGQACGTCGINLFFLLQLKMHNAKCRFLVDGLNSEKREFNLAGIEVI